MNLSGGGVKTNVGLMENRYYTTAKEVRCRVPGLFGGGDLRDARGT
jgi:thioredoxin reductase